MICRIKQNRQKIFWFVLAVCSMALIFAFSHQKAQESTQVSSFMSYGMARKINFIFSLDWTKETLVNYAGIWEYPLRKAAHMSEYAFLAVVYLGNFSQYKKTYSKRYILAWAAAVLYAASDEFHQLFVEGRSGQFSDVCIDGGGALLGVCFAWMFLRLTESLIIKYKNKKKEVTDNGRT